MAGHSYIDLKKKAPDEQGNSVYVRHEICHFLHLWATQTYVKDKLSLD